MTTSTRRKLWQLRSARGGTTASAAIRAALRELPERAWQGQLPRQDVTSKGTRYQTVWVEEATVARIDYVFGPRHRAPMVARAIEWAFDDLGDSP